MAAARHVKSESNGEQIGAADCDHGDAEPLGVGGAAMYLGCSCGVVLIVQGDRVWAISDSSRRAA